MKLPPNVDGMSIKILKDNLSANEIWPAKGSYLVRRDTDHDWYGTGWTDRADSMFDNNWELERVVMEELFSQGDIYVHYPDEFNAELHIGDIFMWVTGSNNGQLYKIDDITQKSIEINNGEGSWIYIREVVEDWVRTNEVKLVDGPRIIKYGVQMVSHSVSDPKNNGSREKCFWCGKETISLNSGFGMSKARMCESCKK